MQTSNERLPHVIDRLSAGTNLFITGGAGVGKTTLTRQVIAAFGAEGKKIAKLASTGMAATLIGGQTLHSFFDLGLADSEDDLERRGKLIPKRKLVKLVRQMDLIIIDEISMVSAEVLDMVRLRLRQCNYKGPLLVVGDFLQLAPVRRDAVRFAFEAHSWQQFAFETVLLTHNFRSEDVDFNSVLNAVRFAAVTYDEHCYLHELIRPIDEDALQNHTFLYGTNRSAEAHNARQLNAAEGDLHIYEAQVVRHKSTITDQEIDRFFEESRVPRQLKLKIGAPVLFTRNAWNFVNGERGTVAKVGDDVIHVRKTNGVVIKLETMATDRMRWEEHRIDDELQMVETAQFTIHQFPLILAYAITIHKSQGMSIEDLVIDTTEIFAPSQFYVALSRATSPQHLTLIQPRVNWVHLAFVHPKALTWVREQSPLPTREHHPEGE